jgi:hypothetical protein
MSGRANGASRVERLIVVANERLGERPVAFAARMAQLSEWGWLELELTRSC